MPEMIDGLSMNLEQINADKLKSVFPECYTEGKLDIDKLLSLCGEYITNDFEKYKFDWKGKSECLQLAQKRSTGTLRPCPEESVNWDTTQNLYIEGDNLEVLKLLQTAYFRKVKMIFIDPPYNTGNDFVYEDDFADPIQRYKEVTQQTTKSNPETMGRYHTNWLNMMYPRLRLAANLLRDEGVIFISIDDGEQSNLRKLCDEVFGEENFVAQVVWQKKYSVSNDDPGIAAMHDYILIYQKSNAFQRNLLPRKEKQLERYKNPDNDPRGDWMSGEYVSSKTRWQRPTLWYPIKHPRTGEEVWPDENAVWRYSQEKHSEMEADNRLYWGPGLTYEKPRLKRFLSEMKDGIVPSTWWTFDDVGHTDEAAKETNDLVGKKVFTTPKPVRLLKRMITLGASNDDIILDFFSGSAASAHAVMQLNAEDGGNRRFILVQLPEVCDEKSEAYKAGYKNICEIGKERIRKAGAKIKKDIEYPQDEKDGSIRIAHGLTGSRNIGEEYSLQNATVADQTFMDIDSGEIIQESFAVKEERNKYRFNPKLLDTGFRVFKLDTSNLKTWDSTPIADEDLPALYERMNGMINRVKTDRTDMDMVCEVMLKLGVPLSYNVTKVDISGKTAYIVGDDSLLLICLAENVLPENIEQMTEHTPAKIIIARDSFADDTAMANAYYILRDKGIELKLI